jgi:hypothetical protein
VKWESSIPHNVLSLLQIINIITLEQQLAKIVFGFAPSSGDTTVFIVYQKLLSKIRRRNILFYSDRRGVLYFVAGPLGKSGKLAADFDCRSLPSLRESLR